MQLNTEGTKETKHSRSERSSIQRLRSVFGVCAMAVASALLLSACPDPDSGTSNQEKLIEPVDGVTVPLPVDYNQLAAAYFSPEGRAMIGVFPGTPIPNNGLTVDVVDPASMAAPLAAMNPEFALEMGPSGTVFADPVRVSTVIGRTITNDDDETMLPFFDVFTMNNGQPERIEGVGIEIDEDGLITTHALMPHFSPLALKALKGFKFKSISPVKNPMSWVGGTISTKVLVTNELKDDQYRFFVESNAAIRGTLKNPQFKNERYYLDKETSANVAVGSCDCSAVGKGQIKLELRVKKYNNKDNTLVEMNKRKIINVKCIEFNLQMEVYGDPDGNVTDYRVRGTVREPGDTQTDILNPETRKKIKVEWDFSGIKCGKPEKDMQFGAYWPHYDCDPAKEEESKIKCKVTYTDADGRTVTKVYEAPARANEGKKVPF